MAEWQIAGLYVFGTVQGVILGWWLWRRPSLKYARAIEAAHGIAAKEAP